MLIKKSIKIILKNLKLLSNNYQLILISNLSIISWCSLGLSSPTSEKIAEKFPERSLLISQNNTNNNEKISVERIEILGSTVFTEEDFAPIIEPLEAQQVTPEQIENAVNQVTELYINNGYLTSNAVLVKESLTTGIIQIQVIEGSITEIIIEGTKRLNASYVRQRVARGATTPFNPQKLENQLRLLRANPLFKNVQASLRRGAGLNQSTIIVLVEEAKSFSGNVGINNYSPPSVGSEKFLVNFRYRNLTGIGDEIFAGYQRTTAGGADEWDFRYQAPVNSLDGKVRFRGIINRNRVIQEPFADFNIEGKSDLFQLNYRQPLIRTPREEFALSVGFTYQDGQTFLLDQPIGFGFGPDENGVSRTSVINFGQEYIRRGVSGSWLLRSNLNFGTGLFDATRNEGTIPDGLFFSWLGQVQRAQIISPSNLLIIQADLQLTPDSLLPAQQFIIGGGQSVRGYRQNLLAGDIGMRISVEDRITLGRDNAGVPTFQLAPFLDAGFVENTEGNPNKLTQRQNVIVGLGLGILVQPITNLNIRLDYGLGLVDIDNKGTNAQDDGFYFSVNYGF